MLSAQNVIDTLCILMIAAWLVDFSWDRKPLLWLDSDDGRTLRMIPEQMKIHNNFAFRASFLGDSKNLYCVDHDDGSSMYNGIMYPNGCLDLPVTASDIHACSDTSNFLIYGGIKFREVTVS